MKKIVIIGAGYSGVLTAKKLAKKFKKYNKNNDVMVTIIDKNPFHTMLTELHEVAAGRVEEESIRISYKKVFAGRRVDFVQDTVERVDFKEKVVHGKDGRYEYDIVVMAAGSRPTYFGTPGAEQYAYSLWSFEDAVKLKVRFHECFRKAAEETDTAEKKKLLTFYVIGAGFTGVEMIGELAEYVPILCDKYDIDPELVTMANVDVLQRVVPTLPEKLSAKIQRRLEKMGVTVKLGMKVVEIGEGFIELDNGTDRVREIVDTVIWVAGIESAGITQAVAELIPSRRRGCLNTDQYLRSTQNEDVYVAGDNICYIPEGEKVPVPQMVENCEQSADTIAHNIFTTITGQGEMEEYKPKFHGVMVCVGGRYGLARVGTAKSMINLPSFLAMFVKHFINIIYFIQVLGWNKVVSYFKHEFFTIRNKRSFVGGHFSNRSPSFLLVMFRMWLGAVWIFEGIMKIVEGWMKTPKLEGFFGGATSWFNNVLGIVDEAGGSGVTEAVTDAVTSATPQAGAESVGTVIFNINFLGLFRAIFVSGKTLAESTIADYAFKLDVPVMTWFVNTVILPNPGLAVAMQIFIVVAEILIGLSMMGGLITTLTSVVSLVLLLMFTATTGLYLSSFWMVFGAIALMFGSSKVFGIDYYVSPLLKKGWHSIRWVRRSYLYHD